MPSSLSKLLGDAGIKVIPFSCYELGHTWEPSCVVANSGLWLDALKDSLKVYSTLYLLTTAFKRPSLKDVKPLRLALDILRSSLFLSANAFLFLSSLCVIRKQLGFFSFTSIGLTPGFIASLLAILIERKRRRGMLALYLTQLASEILYRMCISRGLVKAIPFGEVLLFSVAVGGFMLLNSLNLLDPDTAKAVNFVFGISKPAEVKSAAEKKKVRIDSMSYRLAKLLETLGNRIKSLPSSVSCQHQFSCVDYCLLQGFAKRFGATYGISAVVSTVMSIPKVIKGQSAAGILLKKLLLNGGSLKLGLFVGGLPGLFRFTQCLLKWLSDSIPYGNLDFVRNEHLVKCLAALVAGTSMMFYRSGSIALYVIWKLIEAIYFAAANRNLLPKYYWGDVIIYACSTAFVLHAAVMEPQALRPAYWKFLMGLTGQKFSLVYRRLLDVWGCHSSSAMPDFKPALDALHTTFNPVLMP